LKSKVDTQEQDQTESISKDQRISRRQKFRKDFKIFLTGVIEPSAISRIFQRFGGGLGEPDVPLFFPWKPVCSIPAGIINHLSTKSSSQ
jgi:hypothetical protein